MRLRAQRLTQGRRSGVRQVVLTCAVSRRRTPSPGSWLSASGVRLTARCVEEVRTIHRSVVLTWAMRGTMHLIASEDAGWFLSLLGPVMIRKSRRRHRELGLTEEVGARAVADLRDVLLAHGPMSRAEIAARLSGKGIPVEGQAIYHIVRLAALEGWSASVRTKATKGTYDLLDRWSPAPRRVDDLWLSLPAGTSRHTGPQDLTTSRHGQDFR